MSLVFCQKLVNHLHQPVNLMGEGSCTFSSYLTGTGVWGRSRQRLAILGHLLPR